LLAPLHPVPGLSADELLDRFLSYAAAKGLELYPAQEEAILALFEGQNVVLNTPTGSGKSLVAAALHFEALSRGRRSVYTCPIKALVNEKFLALCRDFGPENVGMMTGDATVNRNAPILCCTAEILANLALSGGAERAGVDDAVIDEFHYYSDRERGVSWQIPLITLSKTRFLLMSATLGGNAGVLTDRLEKLTGRPTALVRSTDRPVPLDFTYSDEPLDKTVESLLAAGKAPVYVVSFAQRDAAELAQNFTSLNVSSREERSSLGEELASFRFSSPNGAEMKRLLRQGIGLHHAGLLPKYRLLVEKLAQAGKLKIICGTDTLGVGVNVPIRTVLLTRLCKYDGEKARILSVRDFHQIAGRAGRKGFDDLGWVVAQAPEHVIENRVQEAKAAGDPAKKRKLVKRKPPEKGFVNWDENTFRRLISAEAEGLSSQFHVSHGMLLQVLSRSHEDGCRAMQRLINDSHEPAMAKPKHRRRAWQLFRSLLERKIVEIVPKFDDAFSPKLRVNVELQADFSLNQVLSLYLVDAVAALDRDHPDYSLDVLSLAEAIVEDPDPILRKQRDRAKGDKLAELKAADMPYEQRMAELDKVEHPKPLREFTYETFNAFAAAHPWVGEENIRPKSIAREMFERLMSFSDYVRDYELQRAEGLLLRHLSGVYRVIAQTVPDAAKTDELRELEAWLGAVVRQTDASLLEEWERIRNPDAMLAAVSEAAEVRPATPADITRNRATFAAAIRGEIFQLLGPLARGDFESAAERVQAPADAEPWTAAALEKLLAPYFEARSRIRLDPDARNAKRTFFDETDTPGAWLVEQVLVDPEDQNDWSLKLRVDLAQSREDGAPRLVLLGLGPVEGT
jgi:superfamily II RNA helicase